MYGFIIIGLTSCLNYIKLSKSKIRLISTIFLIIFMAITNFTPSVTRASLMTILILLARKFP